MEVVKRTDLMAGGGEQVLAVSHVPGSPCTVGKRPYSRGRDHSSQHCSYSLLLSCCPEVVGATSVAVLYLAWHH